MPNSIALKNRAKYSNMSDSPSNPYTTHTPSQTSPSASLAHHIELVVREYGIEPKDVIKLASNENPRGCSTKVIEAVRNEASKMNLYPDDSMYELKEALS